MRSVSIDELYELQRVLAGSGHPALVAADLSSLRVRAAARPDVLAFAVDPSHDDSRYASTAYRTTIDDGTGRALAVAVTIDQYDTLLGIDVTDPAGRPVESLIAARGGATTTAPAAAPEANRYRTMSIVGFILTLFAFVNIAGLVVSLIALIRSRRAGAPNAFALAGVWIGAAGVLLTIVIAAIAVPVFGPIFVDAAETCGRLGIGVHQVGDLTYSCGYGSFQVSRGF